MSNHKQTLLNAGLNIFGADLLCESLLRAPWVGELHKKGESLRFFFPVNRLDCAGWVGVAISLRPVGEWDVMPSAQAEDFIDAAVKAERERICDLFLTEPISVPVGVNTDEDEIDASIKSDRFKLMTAVREGKPFKSVLDGLPVTEGGAQ